MHHEQWLKAVMNNLMPAGQKIMTWSPPGIGKTELCDQLRDAIAKQYAMKVNLHVWDMTHLYDPVDSRGIPTIATLEDGTKVTRWIAPEHMVMNGEFTIVLLDDLPTLPQSSQAAMLRLIQHGEIGGMKFGKNVYFMGAGNRMGDSSATNAMPFALANRFEHLNLTFTLKGWCERALATGVPTALIAFHRFTQGASLYPIYNDSDSVAVPCGLCRENVQPGSICTHCVKRSRALPTLRAWVELGKILDTNPDSDIEMELYAGKVGKEKAAEFCGYLQMYRQIPSIEGIILGPNTALVPNEPSVLYAVTTALGRIATASNMDAIVQYLERLPKQEFAAICVQDAIRRTPEVQQTRAYVSWSTRHQDLLV